MAAAIVNKVFHACCPKLGRSLRYTKHTSVVNLFYNITPKRQFSNNLLNITKYNGITNSSRYKAFLPVQTSSKLLSSNPSDESIIQSIRNQIINILSQDSTITSTQIDLYLNIIDDVIKQRSSDDAVVNTNDVSPEELYYLGSKLYSLGSIGEEAIELATLVFKQSGLLGFGDAKYTYAQLLLRPSSINKPNPHEAAQLFLELAQDGHPYSQFALAGMYATGYGIELSFENALSLYKVAAQNGITQSFNSIGKLYLNGQGVEKNENKAVEYFKQGADAGEIHANLSLANCYSNGVGVEKDFEKSFQLHMKGADLGNSYAIHNVGTHYFLGKGVERDIHLSAEYFKKASDLGHVLSSVNLGKMYFEGFGVGLDWEKAKLYLQRAGDHNEATLILKEMDRQETKQGISKK